MGLDMYLEKAKRIGNVTPQQLRNVDGYLSWTDESKSGKQFSLKEWCGIDEKDVDMSLVDNYRDDYIHRYSHWDTEKKYGWKTIFQNITSCRKANHIHQWFVDNVQDGVDDCYTYEVTKEQLEELLDVCKGVLAASKLIKGKIKNGEMIKDGKWVASYEDGEYIENPTVARRLLPTQSGFFFGGTEYDQWYYEDVKQTVEIIENVLATTDFEHEIVMYSSSW